MNRRRSNRATSRRSSSADRSPSAPRRGGELRIIGGRHRGRKLAILESPGLRPTPDRVRETLFNWLAVELTGRRVLDLFAGTGALGLEALSRGADEVVFVESSAPVAAAIESSLERLKAHALVVQSDVAAYLAQPPHPFGVAFLDPPFRQDLAEITCERLEQGGWLTDDAFIYIESESELTWTAPMNWQLHREVNAGDSHGRLFRRFRRDS